MASSRANLGGPRAVPILTCKDSGKVQVHHEAIQAIFRHHDVQDKPLCIVSISGAFRKGKSFMLNFFIRYLRNKGHVDKSWMGDVDVPMMDGFDWKGGMKACTNGILIWNEVFTIKQDDGEVAVMLMDTQGLFEGKMGQKANSIIFAFSTLISSVQIFNLSQQIQENDLGFLQFFTAYAEAASKASSDRNTEPFQSLVFLVRDWPHAVEMSYGTVGGAKYLNDVLSVDSTTEELSSVRKYLRSSFKDTRCCLMPHPGQRVAQTSFSFTGCLRDIDEEFLRQTALFVDSLFRPENLVVKTINGRVVSAPAILQYISDCGESLTDGKLPDPKTMMQNVEEAQNFEAQRRCREKYTQNMKEITGESFVDSAFLQDMHADVFQSVMKEFAELTLFGSDKSRRKHREYLEETISREYGMLTQANESMKANCESDLLNFIQCIANQYEESMKAATADQRFVSDQELDGIHGRFTTEAYDSYSTLACPSPQLKEQYFQELMDRLERIYGAIKSENNEKRGIAEEQNELTREMMQWELEHAIQFRNEMREHLEHYMDEQKLKQTADESRKTILDKFEICALENKIMPGCKTFQDHYASLERKLDAEYQQILQINSENKVVLEKALESLRQNAIVKYENFFKTLLKDTYVENEDLIQEHQDVVQRLMANLRSDVGDMSTIPLVAAHLVGTENELDQKCAMIKKWNEKNNTFLRKCFKFAKGAANVAKEVLLVIAECVAKLVLTKKL